MAQYTGKVVWFNFSKGYAFLKAEGMRDVFCYLSSIQEPGYKTLSEGEQVEFDVQQGTEGSQAVNVRRLQRD